MFPGETVPIKWWKSETRDYYQELNIWVASRIAQQFKT